MENDEEKSCTYNEFGKDFEIVNIIPELDTYRQNEKKELIVSRLYEIFSKYIHENTGGKSYRED